MFGSVKMEAVSSTKTELEGDQLQSAKGDITPQNSSDRSSEPDPTGRRDSVSEPVFIKAPKLGYLSGTPAVRIIYTKPEAVTGIFPLSRIELGEVLTQPDEIAALDIFARSWWLVTRIDYFSIICGLSRILLACRDGCIEDSSLYG